MLLLQKTRKYIIGFLCLILFLGLVPTDAKAANETLALNETKTATLGKGQSVTYTFTPEETAEYVFWMDQPGDSGMNWLCYGVYHEGTNDMVSSTSFHQQNYQVSKYTLEAGKNYDVKVWHGDGATQTRSFGIRKATTAGSIRFGQEAYKDYEDLTWTVYLTLDSPAAVNGEFTFTSSNPAVAKITKDENTKAILEYLSPGTATITASNGKVSCSATVTVLENAILQEGTPSYITNPKEGIHYFYFTPQTSGYYAIYTDHYIPIHVMSPSSDLLTGEILWYNGGQGTGVDLAAGVQYQVGVVVTMDIQESGVDKVVVGAELYDEHHVNAPEDGDSGNGNDFNDGNGSNNEQDELTMLELNMAYVFNTGNQERFAGFVPDEDGTYYLHVEGDMPIEWFFVYEDELVYPDEEYFGAEGDKETVYTFLAGREYILMCGASDEHTNIVQLSDSPSMIRDEDGDGYDDREETNNGSDVQKEPIYVEKEQFTEVVEQVEEGSLLHVQAQGANHITLERGAFQVAADRGLDVEIATDAGVIALDNQVLHMIGSSFSGTEVNMQLKPVDEKALSEEQQYVLSGYQVEMVVSADIFDGEKELHDFEGGMATIRLHFSPNEGSSYGVIYVADDGSIEKLATSCGEDYVEFVTGHFSTFVVVDIEGSPELNGGGPVDGTGNGSGSGSGGSDHSSGAGMGWIVAGVVAVVVIAAVVSVVVVREKK